MADAAAGFQQFVISGWRRSSRPLVYGVGLVPAVWLFYQGFTDQLGADPLQALEHALGLWALRFLVLGLAVTALRRSFGINLIRYRRALGLLAFIYASLHVLVYLVLDQGLDWLAIWEDIVKRPYITVGLLAFITLVPLAVTSNNWMVRRLGAAAWQNLHRWVYLAAVAGALHFVMLVKAWPPEPLIYLGLVVVLLLWRVASAVRRRFETRTAG